MSIGQRMQRDTRLSAAIPVNLYTLQAIAAAIALQSKSLTIFIMRRCVPSVVLSLCQTVFILPGNSSITLGEEKKFFLPTIYSVLTVEPEVNNAASRVCHASVAHLIRIG